MTNLSPVHGAGSAEVTAVPSQSPGSSEPGLTSSFAPPVYSATAAPTLVTEAPATPPAAPIARPYDWQAEPSPRRLGVVAFMIAILVLILSVATSVWAGLTLMPLALSAQTMTADTIDAALAGTLGTAVIGILVQVVVGTAFGLWAIVQGIVAIVSRRGRAYGIAAIVIAVSAPAISFVAYGIAGNIAAFGTFG